MPKATSGGADQRHFELQIFTYRKKSHVYD